MKILYTAFVLAVVITGLSATVGFKKQTADNLLKPKERMLADSQQMLDAQDSRKIFSIHI